MDQAPVDLVVRSAVTGDRGLINALLRELWGSETIVSRGVAHQAAELPALLALDGPNVVGLASLSYRAGECELVTLNALQRGRGIGRALLKRTVADATQHSCRRLWLITTNDNLDAIRFYQRGGLRLVAVHPGAVDRARELKPSIPLIGEHGIPIHDELEFELQLTSEAQPPQSGGAQSA